MASITDKVKDLWSKKRVLVLLGAGAVVVVLLLLVMPGGSGQGEGSVFARQAAVTENFVNGMESAKNADDVVEAIDLYTEGMKELVPALQKLGREYEEGKPLPSDAQMKEHMARADAWAGKMPAAMMKIQRYIMNKKVQDAFARMGEQMAALEDNQ